MFAAVTGGRQLCLYIQGRRHSSPFREVPVYDGRIDVSEEVGQAIRAGKAVVALESTVIAHGLPRPRNLETGADLEAEVRRGGATPATIAVLAGVPKVGLTNSEMERVGTGDRVLKLSTRDLPVAMARGHDGATTVASTCWLARRTGIEVFATGGIGGVHRGEPLDISADLLELGRTSILVVCAGAKSILALAATREALESAGVLCLGWRTREFPSFYSVESGLSVDEMVSDADEVAAIWKSARSAGTPGGMLLCVPPPAHAALPTKMVEAAIDRALTKADEQGIRGSDVTPFLLRAIARETDGRSLETNIALLRQNARIGAEVASAIAAG
ncbi:pseudouridine-5'-phosphate glycosidase [soil metagenome]